MNRQDILDDVLGIENKNIVLEFSTGTGKSLCALSVMRKHLTECNSSDKVLIVIPKLVLIDNWLKEIEKWGFDDMKDKIEFSTYNSLDKNYFKQWAMICFDETHHITDRCFSIINMSHNRVETRHLFLSATLSISFKIRLKRTFPDLCIRTISLKEAIENEILPEPTILLYPLYLDNSQETKIYVKGSKGTPTKVKYSQRWPAIKNPEIQPHIMCTEAQYYGLLSEDITYFQKYVKYQQIYKNMLIKRLKILSDFKTEKVKTILKFLKDYRVITFCNSIEQTELLGKNCIHSKNDNRMDVLDDFNNKRIKHITSCDILSEGVNVTDCRIGIFARINSSETALKQKLGRILRHPKPVIIIPYYRHTREEEVVNTKILPEFNQDKIFIIRGINEITNYLN